LAYITYSFYPVYSSFNVYGRALAAAVGGGCTVGSIWMVGRRAEAEAAKLTQPFQGMVSLGTGFYFFVGFFF
jgi:hypothetical protein